jgi:hypothetical protein
MIFLLLILRIICPFFALILILTQEAHFSFLPFFPLIMHNIESEVL